MQKILMLKGLPASGKSTFARELAKDTNWVRVNADDIRLEIGGEFSKSREKAVFKLEDQRIIEALHNGKNVVVDDTNLNSRHIDRIKTDIADSGVKAEIEWKEFIVTLPELIERDKKRGEASVGAGVIRRMWRQYYAPLIYSDNTEKKRAYIVDLDGTLCLFGQDVSPYDRDFYMDYPNKPLIELLQTIKMRYADKVEIIITSGRFIEFGSVTQQWLHDWAVPYDKLLMRDNGDQRHDYEYKHDRYINDIQPYYNVRGVFDDRNQVVDLWRSLGLPTFQVNYGDF